MDRCAACTFAARESSSRAPVCALTGQDNVPDGVSCQPDSGVRVKQEGPPGRKSTVECEESVDPSVSNPADSLLRAPRRGSF